MGIYRSAIKLYLMLAVAWQATMPCCHCVNSPSTIDSANSNQACHENACDCCNDHTKRDSRSKSPSKERHQHCPKGPFCGVVVTATDSHVSPINLRINQCREIVVFQPQSGLLESYLASSHGSFRHRYHSAILPMPGRLLL